MRDILIVFFIISFIFLILITPFKIRTMVHFNLFEKKCFYCVKVWIIKLLCGKSVLENSEIKVTNQNTFITDKYDSKLIKMFSLEVLSKLDVKKVEMFFTGGINEDSFSSAMMCGSILSIIEVIYGVLSLKYINVKMYKDITPTFDEDNFEFTGDIVVSISLIKLAMTMLSVKNKYKKLKECKNEG